MPASYCKVSDCNDTARFKGLCWAHYGRWKRHGDPLAGRKSPYQQIRDGRSKHPLYQTYEAMRKRCGNVPGYENVKVCERWLNDFWAFVADMEPKPSPEHSLDRYPNLKGHYEPGNVRWALSDAQNRNKKSNNLIAAFGRTQTATEWAEETGITRRTISRRLKEGWSAEDALSIPQKKRFGL